MVVPIRDVIAVKSRKLAILFYELLQKVRKLVSLSWDTCRKRIRGGIAFSSKRPVIHSHS